MRIWKKKSFVYIPHKSMLDYNCMIPDCVEDFSIVCMHSCMHGTSVRFVLIIPIPLNTNMYVKVWYTHTTCMTSVYMYMHIYEFA